MAIFAFLRRHAALSLILLIVAVYFVYDIAEGFIAFSRDAYVTTDFVAIAPQVSGPLAQLLVREDQRVKAGDALFVIEQKPYRIAVAQAEAALSLAQANHKSAQDALAAAKADVNGASAALADATASYRRTRTLHGKGDVSTAALDKARDQLDQAQARYDQAMAKQSVAKDQISIRAAKAEEAKQAVAKANYQLEQTRVAAPLAGYVASFNSRAGDFIDAGEDVLAIVDDTKWRIVANLKERHAAQLRPGHRLLFRLSTDPWRLHRGTVKALSRAIVREPGRQGVIPYVRADTDWIRLPRRFPVQIDMGAVPEDRRLLMGADADVLILF